MSNRLTIDWTEADKKDWLCENYNGSWELWIDPAAIYDEIHTLQQDLKDTQECLEDKRRLTRELDIALSGEAGAAQQASLCDLIGQAKEMRMALKEAFENNQKRPPMYRTQMPLLDKIGVRDCWCE